MILHSLEVANFRVFENIGVDFSEGVTGIIGANESGKSSLLEAILWALFGTAATRGTKATLRWRGARPRETASVTLIFEVDGARYRIDRHESTAKLVQGQKVLAQGTTPVDEFVPGLIGMSYEEFRSTYLVLQEEVARIVGMGPTETQAFVRKVLRIDAIDVAVDACRKEKNRLASVVEGQEKGLGGRGQLVAAVDDAKSRLEVAKVDLATTERAYADRAKAVAEAEKEAEAQAELRDEFVRLREEMRARQNDLRYAEKRVREAESAAQRLREFEDRLSAAAVERDVLRAQLEDSDTGKVLEDRKVDLLALQREKEALVAQRVKAQADAGAEARAKDERVSEIDERLAGVEDLAGLDCPTCGQEVDPLYVDDVRERLEDERREHSDQAVRLRERFAMLDSPGSQEAKLATRIQAAQEAVAAAERQHQQTVELKTRMREVSTKFETLQEAAHGVKIDEGADAARAEAARVCKAAEQALEDVGFDPDAHDAAQERLRLASKAASGAQSDVSAQRSAVEWATKAVSGAENALLEHDERAQELEETKADLVLHEKADARLTAFRAAAAGTIRPEWEELVSGFVGVLTDGRHESVEIDEDFRLTLHESGEPSEVISGGTADVAALSMRLALSQMIAERAGHPLSLLVLDEVFGSLDQGRRGAVLDLLNVLSGIFRQVLVISHVAETTDLVDKAIIMEFDEARGASRVAV